MCGVRCMGLELDLSKTDKKSTDYVIPKCVSSDEDIDYFRQKAVPTVTNPQTKRFSSIKNNR